MIILYLLIFAVACYALAISGTILVKVLTAMSRYFRITEYVFAFILMTFATCMPELFVGITAAVDGVSIMSLGNVIGSNLIHLTFILGLVSVMAKGLPVESKIAKRDSWIVLFIAVLPLLLALDKQISRGEGFLLLVVFGWYIYHILKSKEAFSKRVEEIAEDELAVRKIWKNAVYFVVGAIILLGASWLIVEMAKSIAKELYIPLSLVSIILLGIGTSLPELVFGVRAVIAKHEGLSLGNLIGSVVVNSSLVLGLVSIINPIRVENLRVIYTGGIFMAVAIIIANLFIASKDKVSWKEGLMLMIFYIVFLVVEFLFK